MSGNEGQSNTRMSVVPPRAEVLEDRVFFSVFSGHVPPAHVTTRHSSFTLPTILTRQPTSSTRSPFLLAPESAGDLRVPAAPILKEAHSPAHPITVRQVDMGLDVYLLSSGLPMIVPVADAALEFQALARPVLNPTVSPEMTQQMREIFARPIGGHLEPGVDTLFSRSFTWLIEQFGDQALSEAERLIFNPQTSPSVAAEALRWLGIMEDANTRVRRRTVLESALTHSSPIVRDGAIVGLDALEDPAAISAIDAAMRRESSNALRADLEQLRDQLRGA